MKLPVRLRGSQTAPDRASAIASMHRSPTSGPAAELPEERLAQEVAVLATKADVREELDRLEAHCAAGRNLLAGSEPIAD